MFAEEKEIFCFVTFFFFFCQIWPSVFDKTVVLVFFARLSSLGVINLSFKHLARPGVSCVFSISAVFQMLLHPAKNTIQEENTVFFGWKTLKSE